MAAKDAITRCLATNMAVLRPDHFEPGFTAGTRFRRRKQIQIDWAALRMRRREAANDQLCPGLNL